MHDGLTIGPQLQRLSTAMERQWSASTGIPAVTAPSKAGTGARLDLTNRARTTAPLPVLCIDRSASRLLMTRISTATSMFVFSLELTNHCLVEMYQQP